MIVTSLGKLDQPHCCVGYESTDLYLFAKKIILFSDGVSASDVSEFAVITACLM